MGEYLGERPHIEHVQAVNVFERADGLHDDLLLEVVGQRKLHQNPVHLGVGIEFGHQGEQVGLANVDGHVVAKGANAHFFARLLLVAHIRGRVRAVADQYHGQT